MKIEMTPVTGSSQIAGIGYHRESKTLRIKFPDRQHKGNGTVIPGATYDYHEVPEHEHTALLAADSMGAHFHQNIRNGGYRYTKVEE